MGRGPDERHPWDRDEADRILLYNPASGSADHASEVHRRARQRGYAVRETAGAGDARQIAREVGADGASILIVAGGDGTVNEAVHGLSDADALETVDLAVVPTGTANLFARSLGIETIDRAFEVLDRGERRRIDVGVANGNPFVNTCLAGIPAEANTMTPGELKRRLGVFAYVLTTIRHLPEYEGIPLEVRIDLDETNDRRSTREWRGTALLVLIGNAFRLPGIRHRDQPSAEDGLLEVTIVEEWPTFEFLDEGVLSAVLDGDVTPVTRLETPSLSVRGLADGVVTFSLDGELYPATELDVGVRERCLSVYATPPDRGLLQ